MEWIFSIVLGYSTAQIEQLWKLIDSQSLKWTSLVYNSFDTNRHLSPAFETLREQMLFVLQNHRVTVHDNIDSVRISSEGTS